MESTLLTRWIHDALKPFAQELKAAHAGYLAELAATKNKNDRESAAMIADMPRANLLPEITMVSCQTFDLRLVGDTMTLALPGHRGREPPPEPLRNY